MSYTGGMATTFRERHERATQAALRAAAQELINGLKEPKPLGLRGGYTSGAFVSGNLLGSITPTDPQKDKGGWHIFVGTDVEYAVFWDRERGHYNIFTRKVERQERWKPTLIRKMDDINEAYGRTYRRFMS
jgi:hypothetical protein